MRNGYNSRINSILRFSSLVRVNVPALKYRGIPLAESYPASKDCECGLHAVTSSGPALFWPVAVSSDMNVSNLKIILLNNLGVKSLFDSGHLGKLVQRLVVDPHGLTWGLGKGVQHRVTICKECVRYAALILT